MVSNRQPETKGENHISSLYVSKFNSKAADLHLINTFMSQALSSKIATEYGVSTGITVFPLRGII